MLLRVKANTDPRDDSASVKLFEIPTDLLRLISASMIAGSVLKVDTGGELEPAAIAQESVSIADALLAELEIA